MRSVGIKDKRKALIVVVAFNQCVQCCQVTEVAWTQKPKKNKEVRMER